MVALTVAVACGDPAPVSPDAGPAVLVFSASAVRFPDTVIDRFSNDGIRSLTLTNVGSDAREPTFSFSSESDFMIQSTTCRALAAGKSCEVSIQFHPRSLGARRDELVASIADSTTSVTLLGFSVAEQGLRLEPTNGLEFGAEVVGSVQTKRVMVSNESRVMARPYAVSITGAADFAIVHDGCSGTTASLCELDVSFTPSAGSSRNAELLVSSANLGDRVLPLTGIGFLRANLEVTPSTGTFGPVFELTVSAPQTFTVTNSGSAPSADVSLSFGGANVGYFYLDDHCSGSALAVGASCEFVVGYHPGTAGTHTATVVVQSLSVDSVVVSLSGIGDPSQLEISPTAWDFGGILLGQTSAPKTFVVKNIGATSTGALTAEVISYIGADLALVADGCTGVALAPGASCSVAAQATATTHVTGVGRLFATAARGDRMFSTLESAGSIVGALDATDLAADFGTVQLTDVLSRRIHVFNAGDLSIGPIGVSVTGPDAANVGLVEDCSGRSLTRFDTCDLDIALSLSHVGPYDASIQLMAPGTSLAIPVTANVLPANVPPAPAFSGSRTSPTQRMTSP